MKHHHADTHRFLKLMAIASLIVMISAFAGPVGAAPDSKELRCGQAVVDGVDSEWNVPGDFDAWSTSADFVAYMVRAFKPGKEQESALFMRYDLTTQTAYVLVLAKPGVPGLKWADDAWVAIGDEAGKNDNKVVNGNDVPPAFAWIGVGYDGNSDHVQGFEASFHLDPTTSKYLGAHLQVYDDGAQQTSGIADKTMEIKTGCTALGTVIITKRSTGADGTFNFTSTGGLGGVTSFSLITTNGTASITYSNVTPGPYSVTEEAQTPPWRFTNLSCTETVSANTTTSGQVATINLDSGETVTCTYENTKDTPTAVSLASFTAGATGSGVLPWAGALLAALGGAAFVLSQRR